MDCVTWFRRKSCVQIFAHLCSGRTNKLTEPDKKCEWGLLEDELGIIVFWCIHIIWMWNNARTAWFDDGFYITCDYWEGRTLFQLLIESKLKLYCFNSTHSFSLRGKQCLCIYRKLTLFPSFFPPCPYNVVPFCTESSRPNWEWDCARLWVPAAKFLSTCQPSTQPKEPVTKNLYSSLLLCSSTGSHPHRPKNVSESRKKHLKPKSYTVCHLSKSMSQHLQHYRIAPVLEHWEE